MALLAILSATVGTVYIPFMMLLVPLASQSFPIIIFLCFVTYCWYNSRNVFNENPTQKKKSSNLL